MNDSPAPSRRGSPLLDKLRDQYAVFRDHQPLAIGIHKELIAAQPEIKAPELRLAMRVHTASTRYLKALVAGDQRFDLEGRSAGAVTEEQREAARAALAERFKKAAEKRQAEAKARREAAREQERQEQRNAKLTQLAERFNRRRDPA